jgi:putative ABC transport system substrate-binding protein
VAVLWDPHAPGSVPQWQASQQPAQELGLHLYSMEVSSVEHYEAAFKTAVEARNTAIWVTLNPLANSNQKKIAELAIQHGLPSLCARSDYAENGCLMAYGPGYSIEGRDGARYVDKILKGAKPADIPVEQPLRFELVINLQTAHKLGLTVPQMVLFQADKIIR